MASGLRKHADVKVRPKNVTEFLSHKYNIQRYEKRSTIGYLTHKCLTNVAGSGVYRSRTPVYFAKVYSSQSHFTPKIMWLNLIFTNNYAVSDTGEVRNNHTGRILKPYEDKDGYLMVNLTFNGKRRFVGVHRLVAETFIPNPDNLPQVNHKDENKQNNVVSNLEWCDAVYNANYGTRNLKAGRKNAKKVYQYKDGELVGVWLGTKMASRALSIKSSHISDCARGIKKSAGGYTWSYELISE